MNNLNLLGQLTAPTTVGSGDLLGIVVTLLRCVQIIAALVGVFAIIMMIRSLMPTKHERNLHSADDDQNYGQDNQPKRESLQLGCRIGLLLGNNNGKPTRIEDGAKMLTVGRIIIFAWTPSLHVLKNLVCFRNHKKRTMPNSIIHPNSTASKFGPLSFHL
jgi:hypothetical protein